MDIGWPIGPGPLADLGLSIVDPDEREAQRGDRPIGLARAQMTTVHRSVDYDLELDTTTTTPIDNAAALAQFLGSN